MYSFQPVLGTTKRIIIVLLTRYEGDASLECTPVKTCPPGRGFVLNEREECVCPPGHGFDERGVCIPCREDLGFVVDPITGRCICDKTRGLIFDVSTGSCVCPEGYEIDRETGVCVPGQRDFFCIVFSLASLVEIKIGVGFSEWIG